ncbi:MAG TPA: PAS-domain containing protein [Stellaceae bacterium]|nr:PAS-domain containing protein [Stellaceae bacterium]
MIEYAAGICLVAAAIFAVLWGRASMQRRRAGRARDGIAALLGTIPIAAFRWRRDGVEQSMAGSLPGGRVLAYAGFLARLEAGDAARLAAALDELKDTGAIFATTIAADDDTAYAVEGRRTAQGDSVLWVTDASATRRADAARSDAVAQSSALSNVFDALPMPVWRRDADLRLIDCNNAYAAMREMPREALLISRGAAAAGDGDDWMLALAEAAASGAARSERRHIVIAGSRRLLELTEMPDPAGGTIGFALDRTDLESVESEMSRHVNAHGQVLESINAAVAIFGPDQRLNFFNSAYARLWGIEEEWLAGEPWLDELLERLRERRRVPEYADFRAFKRQQFDLFTSLIEPQSELMHLPDGRTLSVSVSPHPLGGMIFVYEDVTDRLALERSYNTLIEVQRETLDNLFEGIAVFGSDGRLKLHSPAYRRIWGLSEADLEGEPHFSEIVEKTRLFYDDNSDGSVTREQIVATVTGETAWRGRLDRPDGLALRLATVPLPDGNVLFTCLDVTDSAQVERALRERNEALETAGRLKSEFIANVSYELRTPLNAIIGFAEILANQYFGPLSPRQLDYSRGILDSSHRLMTLINDILDLATIEAGYMALENGPVEIRDMLDAVITLTRERARSRNLALTLDCPPEIGRVEADERRLKQALFNIVSNAIKFTPSGGSVRLEARFGPPEDGGDLILSVADTGIGIALADQQRIFETFERGNPQARESGAGLGLSLVKSLIELHGGSVEIRSTQGTPGSGTTILCRLPGRLRLPAAPAAVHPAV